MRWLPLFLLLLQPFMALLANPLEETINHAIEAYEQGIEAQDSKNRSDSLNRALRLFLKLESNPGNGKLYYDIAASYEALHEPGFAVLYYLRAQRLRPRDEKIRFQLISLAAREGLHLDQKVPSWQKAFFIPLFLTREEEMMGLSCSLFLLFLCLSLHLWKRRRATLLAALLLLTMTLLFLAPLLYDQYIRPLEAVVVRPYPLLYGAGEEYAVLTKEPLPKGVKVVVKRVEQSGNWLFVQLPSGLEGYISSEAAEII